MSLFPDFRQAGRTAGPSGGRWPRRRGQDRRTPVRGRVGDGCGAGRPRRGSRTLAEAGNDRLAATRVRSAGSGRRLARRRGRSQRHRARGLRGRAASARCSSIPSTILTTAISTTRRSSIAAICRSRSRPAGTVLPWPSAFASSSSSSSAPSTSPGFASWAKRGRGCSPVRWIPTSARRSCTSWPPLRRVQRVRRLPACMALEWCTWSAAGPGDPELLTVKALRILGQADVVLHDDLLTDEILELIPPTARIECVGKRHGERQMTQQEINRRLCQYGAAGQTVVRLKGGDGAIFGRASEEMDALRAADVPFTIVPGVTAASGAAAAARVSLTDRRLGSALVFLTAQRCKGNPPPNWKAVAAARRGHGDLHARWSRRGVGASAHRCRAVRVDAVFRGGERLAARRTGGRNDAGRAARHSAPAAAGVLLIGVLSAKH